jgi:talin
LQTEERLAGSGVDNMSFADFQTSMVQLCKKIARTAQDMTVKAGSQPSELGGLANLLTRDYAQLAVDSRGAVATTTSQEVRVRDQWTDSSRHFCPF